MKNNHNKPLTSLSLRQKLLNDCRLLAAFSREVCEQAEREDEKAVTASLAGQRRKDLLMLLDALIEHLAEVRAADELPGSCEDAKALRAYALAALGEYIKRVGDPLGVAGQTTKLALAFTDSLVNRDLFFVENLRKDFVRGFASGGLETLTKVGHLQLVGSEWLRLLLEKQTKQKTESKKVGEWMLRECRGVEALARQRGCPPADCAEAYWEANRLECELARRFPPSLRGYESVACLRQKFVRG